LIETKRKEYFQPDNLLKALMALLDHVEWVKLTQIAPRLAHLRNTLTDPSSEFEG